MKHIERINRIGQKFGRYTVIGLGKPKYVKCQCSCGTVKHVLTSNLLNGSIESCGCLFKERVSTHGLSKSALYKIWMSMKSRCLNPKNKHFNHYGGRGISICEQWTNDFQRFYDDMGPRPVGTWIERIDVNGNYCPENCKWASIREQQRNRTDAVRFIFQGKLMHVKEISAITGLSYQSLVYRAKQGIDLAAERYATSSKRRKL